MRKTQGPLAGVRIVELGGTGPVPFCCMLLADLGADIIRIDRPPGHDGGQPGDPRFNLLNRGRRSAALDHVYETQDGRWISVGSNEARFWRQTLEVLGLDEAEMPDQHDRSRWPEVQARFAEIFRTRTRDEWCALAEGREVCFAPVMSLAEAPGHPHLRARGTFVERDGVVQPAPAPRFSRTPGAIQNSPARPGEHTDVVLGDWGFSAPDIAALRAAGAIV
ncbi:CoA transferase [Cupriavidus necator]|uniref:L-carnitine dehydratase/bile acid-inducible protein F n=1 Tax=Cupriavidus pinatubonensis (strain JMP 134 / LMG 1197) TaxID=264198 RepID=Q470I9_CUPPJ|nr:CoA transferase [Cupriavidus necator]